MIQWLNKLVASFRPATNQKLTDIAWPEGNNTRLQVSDFSDQLLVVRFTTPAASARVKSLQVSQLPSAPQVFRVATLATQPCIMATGPGTSATVIASVVSQSPVFRLAVGAGRMGVIGLRPNTPYFLNILNRDNYNGPSNCIGHCGVFVDFTN